MVFSYLEPVLHKAQLVLGGGLCFEFFSYSFPRAVAMSGTQCNPLECPSPRGCARQTFLTPEVVAFRHKKGQSWRAFIFWPAGSQIAPGRSPEWLPNQRKHTLDVFISQIPISLSNYARHATPSRLRVRSHGSNRHFKTSVWEDNEWTLDHVMRRPHHRVGFNLLCSTPETTLKKSSF